MADHSDDLDELLDSKRKNPFYLFSLILYLF